MSRLATFVPGAILIFLIVGGLAPAQPSATPGYATIVVKLSESATLQIGDKVFGQKGAVRTLYTPKLEPGFTYTYVLEATWSEDGQEKRATRTISFQPNQTAEVDMTARDVPAIGDKKIEAKKDEPKKEEPKVEAKKEEPKKIATKEPEPKRVDTKKDEPKKVDARIWGKSRTFLFTYAGTVNDLNPGQEASVWLPVPANSPEQDAEIVAKKLPTNGSFFEEKLYGNKALFFKTKADGAGKIPFEIVYRVTRKEVKSDSRANLTLEPRGTEKVSRFLEPDKLVPIAGKPLELIKEKYLPKDDQIAAAKILYDVVDGHMKYSKEGKGWGNGDAVWACDSKFGNCTDFHSLFISMARGNKIPSKFEMGFSLPPERGAGVIGGYHCWAWFMPKGKGWVPVDISEANRYPRMKDYYFGSLTEDRVQFTTGRDIDLEPKQKGSALNYFIYPYVEVDGQVYPQEKIGRSFGYQDVK